MGPSGHRVMEIIPMDILPHSSTMFLAFSLSPMGPESFFSLLEQTAPSPNWRCFAALYRAVLGGFRDVVGWRWVFHRPTAG